MTQLLFAYSTNHSKANTPTPSWMPRRITRLRISLDRKQDQGHSRTDHNPLQWDFVRHRPEEQHADRIAACILRTSSDRKHDPAWRFSFPLAVSWLSLFVPRSRRFRSAPFPRRFPRWSAGDGRIAQPPRRQACKFGHTKRAVQNGQP